MDAFQLRLCHPSDRIQSLKAMARVSGCIEAPRAQAGSLGGGSMDRHRVWLPLGKVSSLGVNLNIFKGRHQETAASRRIWASAAPTLPMSCLSVRL